MTIFDAEWADQRRRILSKIQSEDIPRIEACARKTGSYFAAKNAELIHFTRKKVEQLQCQLIMNGKIKTFAHSAKDCTYPYLFAFRTVGIATLDVEANVLPTHLRILGGNYSFRN
jgi:hypothetical protein